jgi:serine/threonine-protein kinase
MKRFLKGIGIFLALVLVGVLSAIAVVALLLRQEEVRTPDLTGQDIVSVIEIVSREGLQIKVDRREPSQTIPRDVVISQTPPPGSGIKKGRAVRVVVSQGPSELLTPSLIGERYRKAEFAVRQAGFLPPDITPVWSDTAERDTVIAQDPPAGTPLEKGGKISLLVSRGKRTPVFVMPKLLGRKAEEAVRAVDRMGLQHRLAEKASPADSSAGERIVVSQKPAPGHPVAADGMVEIVVSR